MSLYYTIKSGSPLTTLFSSTKVTGQYPYIDFSYAIISADLWTFNLNGIPLNDEKIILFENLFGLDKNISFSI